jgi:hypothetical protein
VILGTALAGRYFTAMRIALVNIAHIIDWLRASSPQDMRLTKADWWQTV